MSEEIINTTKDPSASSKIKHSKFKLLLQEMDISLKEIEEQTGIAYPTLINLKKGRPINFRRRTLEDIALYLGVSVSDIIDDPIEMEECDSAFDKILKDRRLTLQKVCDDTGVSYPILLNLKKGRAINCRKRTLRDIADYLEVTPEDLTKKVIENKSKSTKKRNK